MTQFIKKRLVKVALWVILSLFLLLGAVMGAVQFPYVQTKLVSYISNYYSQLLDYDIHIDHIAIRWFDTIKIDNLSITDPEENPLITVADLSINFNLQALLNKTNHNIDELIINGAGIYLTPILVSDTLQVLNINDLIRRVRELSQSKTGKKPLISVNHIALDNARFTYNDPFRDTITDGFDYNHFTVDSLHADIDNFQTVADTVFMHINTLQGVSPATGLRINEMKTTFMVSQTMMQFEKLALKVGNSVINDHVTFFYESTRDFRDFIHNIKIQAHFDRTVLDTRDLTLFVPKLAKYDDRFYLSGDANGRITGLSLTDGELRFGHASVLRGKMRLDGLPNIDETFIDFDLVNSRVIPRDIKPYMKENGYKRIEPLGEIAFSAGFLGFPSDFVAKGDFYTQYGRVTSDINLKLAENINESVYRGKVDMYSFNIGGYTDNKNFQKVTLHGQIEGSGFTIESADFELKGNISKLGINNYEYKNIKTDARFSKEFIEGDISIRDPNLKFKGSGSVDLRKNRNIINVDARLDTAFLQPLHISDDFLFISSKFSINGRGLEIDSIIGSAQLKKTTIKYKNNSLMIDSLGLISDREAGKRSLELKTNLIDIFIDGDFNYATIYDELKNLYKEYQLTVANNQEALEKYYAEKAPSIDIDQSLHYKVNIKDLNPLLQLATDDFYVSANNTLDGTVTLGYTAIVSLNTSVDTILYKGNSFVGNELQVNISKIANTSNILAMIYAGSKQQNIAGIETKNLYTENIWNNAHIDFYFDIDQVAYDNHASVMGNVDFLTDSTRIQIDPSSLQILDKQWVFDKNNEIIIKGREVAVSGLRVYHENQSIALNGKVSEFPGESLMFTVDSVKLENLNTILDKDLSGKVNGYTYLRDYYKEIQVESEMTVSALKIDKFLIGDVYGSNTWENKDKRFLIDVYINRLKHKILSLKGNFTPNKKENPLNLTALLDQTELKILEPFIDLYFTRIQGTATGQLAITGTPSSPEIRGVGALQNAGLHINYLNTDYRLAGDFYFEHNRIGFKEITLTDTRGSEAVLSGVATHQAFKQFALDLEGVMDRFMVLNTTSEDNKLFYGIGIASGTVKFTGPVKNLTITARAKTEKGTRIAIPIGDTESIEQEEYINFTSLRDSTEVSKEGVVSKIDLRGLKIDFDLDITPDAFCEIIFDIKAGDIIRGRGNGDIKLQIDTKGEFNMFGDFNIQEGGYNFTLYNIINKEFDMIPGSKISWYGDPYQGILDIKATYNQLASMLPLMVQTESDLLQDVTEIRRKYSVKVLLDINGPLLTPAINFDIVAENLPRNVNTPNGRVVDLEFEFLKFKNGIDEQELKRQVFSLIVLRKFSPLQSFNTGGAITSSVSELFSNQLSYWVTQVDENLEIDVDLGKMDTEAFNTFQLRLSYTFLDGRLRVTRDGGFTNQENKADISSIAGDWTLEYLLTSDGKFKVKMYNRTNYNPIKESQNNITTGFSLIHTQSFDELKELLNKSRNKSKDQNSEDDTESAAEAIIKEEEEGG